MSLKDTLLALCVIIIWGLNFVAIKIGLNALPPFLLAGLRFLLVAFPAIFFVSRPKISLKWMVIYGMVMSFAQFSFLFCAIKFGMPAGVASLVAQSQVFFTIIFGMIFFKEGIRINQLLGMIVATIGMIILAKVSLENSAVSHMTMVGFFLTLGAAFSWALGNISNKIILRDALNVNALSLVIWGALIPIIPFFLCSWVFEGQTVMIHSLQTIERQSIWALMYLAFMASIIGYGIWGYLLSRYEMWRVAPLTLMVPIIGITSAALLLGEKLSMLQIIGALFIMLGLLINIFGARLKNILADSYK